MTYEFTAAIHKEGNRTFVPIPFNVWEETGRKGNIPCRVVIEALSFECKLIPKGRGAYWIPVNKCILTALSQEKDVEVTLEPIASLSRINHDSPYSKEFPVRKIDSIQSIPIQPGLCGQCCVAMLAGVRLDDVISVMGRGRASWSKILEALDYYGISYAGKAVYPRDKSFQLPHCCIVNNDNSFLLWYEGAFCGVHGVDQSKTIGYIQILLPPKIGKDEVE